MPIAILKSAAEPHLRPRSALTRGAPRAGKGAGATQRPPENLRLILKERTAAFPNPDSSGYVMGNVSCGATRPVPPPRLSTRSAFRKQTSAGTCGNEQDAPLAVVRRA